MAARPARTVICRICTVPTEPEATSNMFESRVADGYSLADVVALTGAIEVNREEEALPEWCCFQCQLDVEMAYRVRVLCRESDRKLREQLAATSNICRVCTVPIGPEGTSNMFESSVADGYSLAEVMAIIGAIEVCAEEEGLPKGCCLQCQLDAEMAYRVRVLCQESDRKLREQLDEQDKHSDEEEASIIKNEPFMEDDENETIVLDDSSDQDEPTELRNMDIFEEVPATKIRCCSCRYLCDSEADLLVHGRKVHAVGNPLRDTTSERFCRVCYKMVKIDCFRYHKRKPKTLFRCKVCGELFLSKTQVGTHHLTMHYKPGQCCGCKKTFETAEALRLHSELVHLPQRNPSNEGSPFECNICYVDFRVRSKFYQHRKNKSFSCSKCNKSFNALTTLQNHQMTHKHPVTYRCKLCSKAFNDRCLYKRHSLQHKVSNGRFKCDICSQTFTQRASLIDHNIARHGIPGPFPCEFCPSTFAFPYRLTAHKLSVHVGKQDEKQGGTVDLICKMEVGEPVISLPDSEEGNKVSVVPSHLNEPEQQEYAGFFERIPLARSRCCGCNQFFNSEQEMLCHAKRKHAVGDPAKPTMYKKPCDVCFRLVDVADLQEHHESRKALFRCKECGKEFTTCKRVRSHHVVKHYSYRQCCYCRIEFDTVEALRLHSDQVHLPEKGPRNEERPYECNVCYRNFTIYGHLYEHRTRMTPKEFKCFQCEQRFHLREEQRRHELLHKNLKAFRCKLCPSVAFNNYNHYKKHNAWHQGRKTHTCETCGKVYPRRTSLFEHRASAHGAKKPLQCRLCPASFCYRKQFLDHIRETHSEERQSQTDGAQKRQDSTEINVTMEQLLSIGIARSFKKDG